MVFPEELILKKHTSELYERLKNTSHLSKAQLHKESSKWDSVYLTQVKELLLIGEPTYQ
ncbi:hypothetical protein NQ318_002485 [Aromia moschata]|uniref:Uncharacterized protein n=1 Tax=Aromia moschata TaxID=1265417 RepID=A0AAV8Y7I5_9CUCU|nr:hypothetical protein NQ318_002485 [Aromia moschata]